KLTFEDYTNINTTVIAKIEKHYEDVTKQLGFKVKVPESLINGLGYQALGGKHLDEAGYLFKMNVANYPESSNVYDSLGDFFQAKGDKASAMDNFKKALSIKEVPETRKK